MEHSNTFSASWAGSEFRDVFAPYAGKPRSSTNGGRDFAALWDICDGCILWLPLEYDRCKISGPLTPPEGVLDHPILVLHASVSGPKKAVISFAIMRSFKGDGPDESHPLFWDRYLKIATANSQVEAERDGRLLGKTARGRGRKDSRSVLLASSSDDNFLYLVKERGKGSMKKDSYVDLSAIYNVDWQELQCYATGQKPDAYRHRLTKVSFLKVLERMETKLGAQSSIWVQTDRLWETFARNQLSFHCGMEPLEPVSTPQENGPAGGDLKT